MSAPRIAAALLVVAAALFAWPRSAEDRVRGVIEGAVMDFAAGRFRSCIASLDEGFLDTSSGRKIDRLTLVTALRQLRSGEGSSLYARFPDHEPVEVELDDPEDPTHARARFAVEFFSIHPKASYVDPDAPVVLAIEVDAVLRRGDDGAWRFWRAEHETTAGTAPYR
jgi:hypothetical protein